MRNIVTQSTTLYGWVNLKDALIAGFQHIKNRKLGRTHFKLHRN